METTYSVEAIAGSEAGQGPSAELIVPDKALSACIFGAFVRDTRGCNLSHSDRFNYFAASPFCALSWSFEGQFHAILSDEHFADPASAQLHPPIAFSGPYQNPVASWNHGEVYSMVLCFYPDAFHEITGIEVEKYTSTTVPVDQVLAGKLLEQVTSVFELRDAHAVFRSMEQYLTPVWAASRAATPALIRTFTDWSRHFALRSAISGPGRSVRQIERRVKAWAGQSRQKLNRYATTEQLYASALAAKEQGELDLAQLAAETGFADQSHMGRQTRQITGHSPARLLQRIETEEAFWSYRVMGGQLLNIRKGSDD